MALSISPAFAHASTTAASDDSATSSNSIPGYPRDEFGGLHNKTSDKWGMTYDPVTYQVVENMLTGRDYKQVKCTFVPPYLQ